MNFLSSKIFSCSVSEAEIKNQILKQKIFLVPLRIKKLPGFWELCAMNWGKRSEVKSLSHVRLFATPWTVAHSGSSVHGILQARILEWVAISFSRGSSQLRDQTWVSCIAGRRFILWANREALRTRWMRRNFPTSYHNIHYKVVMVNIAQTSTRTRRLTDQDRKPRNRSMCNVNLT